MSDSFTIFLDQELISYQDCDEILKLLSILLLKVTDSFSFAQKYVQWSIFVKDYPHSRLNCGHINREVLVCELGVFPMGRGLRYIDVILPNSCLVIANRECKMSLSCTCLCHLDTSA